MATRRKASKRRYGKAAGENVASAMGRRKRGTLRSGKGGKGGKVTNPKQAIAIGLSEAREKGAKVPSPRKRAGSSRSGRSRSTSRSTSRSKARSTSRSTPRSRSRAKK